MKAMNLAEGSILIISTDPTSVGHIYRVINHAECLEKLGFVVHILDADSALAAIVALSDLKAVILFRPSLNHFFLEWRSITSARNIPLLADLDDITFDVTLLENGDWHYWQCLDDVGKAQWRDRFLKQRDALQLVDGVVVSTHPLKQAVQYFDHPSWVWPNGFGRLSWSIASHHRRFRSEKKDESVVVVGYASGTPTHAADFALVAPALAHLCSCFPQVRLELIGALDPHHYPILNPYHSQILKRPAVPYSNLPAALSRLDINLAPLELNSRFCSAKSELKFFEAAAVGVPTVASPTPPFKDVIQDGRNGYLASSQDDWFQALSLMVLKPALRRRLARHAFRTTSQLFSPVAQYRVLRQLVNDGLFHG